MKNVLIVTGQHFATAPRKVDLHFIADALMEQGNRVDFLTIRLSLISRFLKDGRWEQARLRVHNRWVAVAPQMDEFIWVNLVHPLNLGVPAVNAVSGLLFRHYGRLLPRAVRERLKTYTHILIESGPAPLLTPVIRAEAPDARIIYHAADRLRTIGLHPVVERVFRSTIGDYDLIHIMAEALRDDMPPGPPVLHLPHGISREAFDAPSPSPYAGSRNVVSVGDMLFDADTVTTLARGNPDWTFHLFGKQARLGQTLPNVVTHGEVPFDRVVAYIKHADIGLAPYLDNQDADYLSQSSLKMIQYTYCRLPILAPAFAAAGRGHVVAYTPGDAASLGTAFQTAAGFDRDTIDTSRAISWAEKTGMLFS